MTQAPCRKCGNYGARNAGREGRVFLTGPAFWAMLWANQQRRRNKDEEPSLRTCRRSAPFGKRSGLCARSEPESKDADERPNGSTRRAAGLGRGPEGSGRWWRRSEHADAEPGGSQPAANANAGRTARANAGPATRASAGRTTWGNAGRAARTAGWRNAARRRDARRHARKADNRAEDQSARDGTDAWPAPDTCELPRRRAYPAHRAPRCSPAGDRCDLPRMGKLRIFRLWRRNRDRGSRYICNHQRASAVERQKSEI